MEHTEEYKRIIKIFNDVSKGRLPLSYLDWCANRIDWAWKWRRITREEMEELADKVIAFNGG